MNETLHEKTLSMLLCLKEAEMALNGVNDYGDASGFCAELDQIENDAHAMIGTLRARAANVKLRMSRHKRDGLPLTMLNQPAATSANGSHEPCPTKTKE